ncbi:MAG: hemerythrin domain-containing protein [Acidimicrobiales bacterium]
MAQDALTLLKDDHKELEALFKKFESAGPRAHKSKRTLVDKMIRELSVHAAVEEQVLYPVTRQLFEDDLGSDVLEALEEHLAAKRLLADLDGMDPQHERFDAKVTVLMESVRHHVEEEEKELFPELKKRIKPAARQELGGIIAEAKKVAPTRAHPNAPDEPPGNTVATSVAALLDRARDAGAAAVGGAKAGVRAGARKARS